MMAGRLAMLAFGFGLCWSFAIVIFSAGVAGVLPITRSVTIGVWLAICTALACNKLLAASQYFRSPDPAGSISRQLLAEGAGAFLVLLTGGAVLLR
jgi:hypothetical protein